MSDKDTTHFGFKDVSKDAKAGMVADVFHSVAARYDLMNDLMSGGIHRIWKRFTIELSGVRKGNAVLDIAGGTGDLAARFAELVGPQGRVVLADINDSMLQVGRDKLLDQGRLGNIEFVQADAQHLEALVRALPQRTGEPREDAALEIRAEVRERAADDRLAAPLEHETARVERPRSPEMTDRRYHRRQGRADHRAERLAECHAVKGCKPSATTGRGRARARATSRRLRTTTS